MGNPPRPSCGDPEVWRAAWKKEGAGKAGPDGEREWETKETPARAGWVMDCAAGDWKAPAAVGRLPASGNSATRAGVRWVGGKSNESTW